MTGTLGLFMNLRQCEGCAAARRDGMHIRPTLERPGPAEQPVPLGRFGALTFLFPEARNILSADRCCHASGGFPHNQERVDYGERRFSIAILLRRNEFLATGVEAATSSLGSCSTTGRKSMVRGDSCAIGHPLGGSRFLMSFAGFDRRCGSVDPLSLRCAVGAA